MKKVKLVVAPHVKSPYKTGQVAFCWVSPRQKDGNVVQISKFTGCKDYLHDALHNHHCEGKSKVSNNSHGYNPSIKPCMDMRRTRLLMCVGSGNSKEQVWSGKRALNLLEDKLGWKNTAIKTVEHPVEKECYMLIGPPQWLGASFFLSVLTLIMRSCAYNPAFEANSWEDVKQNFKKWVENSGRDSRILTNTYERMYPILDMRRKLLKGIKKEDLWPPGIGFGFHNPGGFQSLCRAGTYSEKVNDRVKKLMAEYKL